MKPFYARIALLAIVILLLPGLSLSAAERRTALVIGNSNYASGPLKNPVNDAADMAAALRKAGFTVVLKKDANLETMEEAIEDFGNRLKRGGVGLFYYAGHGVQVGGVNYLIPVGANIKKESDVKFKTFDVGRVLAEMENANNGLNIVILDACRDNPFGRSFRSASRGLAIVSNAPTGTFISYSTGPGQVASDGERRNSPYTSALLKYMREPGVPINDVFMRVRQKLRKETGQVPWELSSLEGKFYFYGSPGAAVVPVEPDKEPVDTDSVPPQKGRSPHFQTITYPSGMKYEGEIVNGLRDGQGTMTFPNGEKYVGQWKNDRRNGWGVNTYANGERYEGDFRDDKRNGRGINTYASGERYEGDFREDKRNGRGINFHANGDRYEGEFRDDKRSGQGTYNFLSGEKYIGQWRDEARNGQGINYYTNGERYEGEFRNNKREGYGTNYFPNGQVLKGMWRNDLFVN